MGCRAPARAGDDEEAPMGLSDELRRLAEQVRKRQTHIRGEEATKNALILPFLSVLGYDVFDPTEVQPEYTSEMGKRRGGPPEKVDYAIHLGPAPVMFVECKAADVEPHQHSGQLARYFNATPSVKVAVVTNGIRYLFFTDLEEQNIMGDKPFFELDVLAFTERDAETLEAFTKARFDPTTVRARAEDIIYTGKVTTYVNELLRNPSDAFTRFILGEIDITTGKLTAKRVEKFVPIVKKAIQSTLLDMATRSIKLETDESTVPAPAPAPQAPAPPPPAPVEARGIVTTAEELDAFDMIRRLCADSSFAEKYPVAYKDAMNYFGVNIGKPKKWFLRLFLDGKRKAIVSKVPADRATMLAPGFEVEAAPEVLGKSRVYISGNKDLDRLRPLVLLAYEDEVRRAEAGASEEEDAAEAAPLPH
ncbi:Prophage Lp2 protein 6 [Minicystis rosea]|nr:Prophage Lp2 protein 6 [Minicystis rosea]